MKPVPLAFKQANVPAMRNKGYQINDALRMEIVRSISRIFPQTEPLTLPHLPKSTSALAISQAEMDSLDQSFDFLTKATTATGMPTPSSLSSSHVDTVVQILERWPASQRFPSKYAQFLVSSSP